METSPNSEPLLSPDAPRCPPPPAAAARGCSLLISTSVNGATLVNVKQLSGEDRLLSVTNTVFVDRPVLCRFVHLMLDFRPTSLLAHGGEHDIDADDMLPVPSSMDLVINICGIVVSPFNQHVAQRCLHRVETAVNLYKKQFREAKG